MGGPFKMKYNNSSFPFKSGEIKTVVDKEEGKGPRANIDLDKEAIKEKMNIVQGDIKEALYEGTDEFRKSRNITDSEKLHRGVKQ
jgi:hypothetical protein